MLTMARRIMLARVLNPADCDIGAAMTLPALIKYFSDMGVASAVDYFRKKMDQII